MFLTRGALVITLALLSVLFVACIFGPPKFIGVMSYRDGRVYLMNKNFYKVGILPDDWKRVDTKVRSVTFYSPEAGASISTSAFCGRGVEGLRPDALSGEILGTLENRSVLSEEKLMLNGRGAVRILTSGSMDGVVSMVDLVTIRKDGCVFDFYAVSPGGQNQATRSAFEGFFQQFHFE